MKNLEGCKAIGCLVTAQIDGIDHYLSTSFIWHPLPDSRSVTVHEPESLQDLYKTIINDEWQGPYPQYLTYVYRAQNGTLITDDDSLPFARKSTDLLELSF